MNVRLFCLGLVLLLRVGGFGAPVLEIEQVLANGVAVDFSPVTGVVLPAGRHHLEIRFRTEGDTPAGWIVQYQLAGHDPIWRTVDGEMALTVRFLGATGRELTSYRLPVPGQNLYWPAAQRRSNLNRRIEPMVVPPGATSLEMAFDSGTWRPELTGEWVIGEVTVNRSSQTFGPAESIWKNPALEPRDPLAKDNYPQHWQRLGDPAVARLEKSPPPPRETIYLMTLRDFSTTAAGAWVSRQPLPAEVKAGEVLTIGWWERSRVGDQRSHSARFVDVPPGNLLFRAVGRGAGAVFIQEGILLPVVIRPYIWTQPWFWPTVTIVVGVLLGLAVWQSVRRRYQRRLAQLELEARIERDRMRIARDLHDDVGAQLTRLSLICAGVMDGAAPQQVEEIAATSRQIAQSMDEIVWAVEPRNDSLDQLGTFLSRFTDEFLEDSGVRPRYSVPASLPSVPLSAEVRHNLFLAVKEALNNAVKYAGAREIRLSVAATTEALDITVADDGKGFELGGVSIGNGLRNMRTRLEEIGGFCRLESTAGTGTQVNFHWPLPKTP